MRLIDADALLNDVKDFPYGYRGMIKSVIENQPTISSPTEGVWLGKHIPYTCSVCGKKYEAADKFCRNCGDDKRKWRAEHGII